MRFASKVWMIAIGAMMCLPAVGQQKVNAAAGINWVPITRAGTPASQGVACSAANYGQPYQNTAVTPNAFYTCGTDGWAIRTGGIGPQGPPGIPGAVGPTGSIQASDGNGGSVVAVPSNVVNALQVSNGQIHFGDSITAASNGVTSTGPNNLPSSNGYAFRLQSVIGGSYANNAVGGTYLFEQNENLYSTVNSYQNGPIINLGGGTNDAIAYQGNVNQQHSFQAMLYGFHAYAATPSSTRIGAQSCTLTGAWTPDNQYGYGNATFTTTAGNSASCPFIIPATGASGAVYACYEIVDGLTGTFHLALDGVNQTDPISGSTTWLSYGYGGANIGTGTQGAVACARFTGLAVGTHNISFTAINGGTPQAGTLPVWVGYATTSPNNPYDFMTILPLQPPSSAGAPYVAAFTAIETSVCANLAADGLNVTCVDVQSALLNSAQPITYTQTLTSTTTTIPGYVSNQGISYYPSGTPLTLVGSAPTVGQYAVSSGGVYTINAADENKQLMFSSTVNCGGGNQTTMFNNCYAGDVHPTNIGQAVMFSKWKSVLNSINFVGQSLANGSPGSPFNSPAAGYPNSYLPMNQWWNPNGLGVGDNVHIPPGIGWYAGGNDSRNFWGQGFNSNGGITMYTPPNVTGYSVCTQSTGSHLPVLLSEYTNCPLQTVGGNTFVGRNSAGFGAEFSSVSGFLGSFPASQGYTTYSQSTFGVEPFAFATPSLNQSSPFLQIANSVWLLAGPGHEPGIYSFQNVAPASGQNDVLHLTHTLPFCDTTPCTNALEVDLGSVLLPPITTVGGSQVCTAATVGTGCGFTPGIATATPGTGVTSVTCTSVTCTNQRGTFAVVGGTATTGTIATLAWPATPTAYVCGVTQNDSGNTAAYLGLGHTNATTIGLAISASISVAGVSFAFDYSCQP